MNSSVIRIGGLPGIGQWIEKDDFESIASALPFFSNDFKEAFADFRRLLNEGQIRAAEKQGGKWVVNSNVKEQILEGFRNGTITEYAHEMNVYYDKDTLPLKRFSAEGKIRTVPGGSSFRDGCYISENVSIMPPSFVNIGAYIDEYTMLDSHVLVGSCAQVGKRVHLSAGVKLGGVLEPIGSLPVIIEDDVFVGGNCGIYGGVIIEQGAVIGAGTVITDKTPIYDLVMKTVYRKEGDSPLIIPANAVVVPGSRSYGEIEGEKIAVQTPVIVKYHSDAINLENALR